MQPREEAWVILEGDFFFFLFIAAGTSFRGYFSCHEGYEITLIFSFYRRKK